MEEELLLAHPLSVILEGEYFPVMTDSPIVTISLVYFDTQIYMCSCNLTSQEREREREKEKEKES